MNWNYHEYFGQCNTEYCVIQDTSIVAICTIRPCDYFMERRWSKVETLFQCANESGIGCHLWNALDLIVFIFMGLLGGVFGALFNTVNLLLTKHRMKHVQKKHKAIRYSNFYHTAVHMPSSLFII